MKDKISETPKHNIIRASSISEEHLKTGVIVKIGEKDDYFAWAILIVDDEEVKYVPFYSPDGKYPFLLELKQEILNNTFEGTDTYYYREDKCF